MGERRYMRWVGNPNGNPEDENKCVNEVSFMPAGAAIVLNETCQCSNKRGHGKNGEYCRQHAKMRGEL